MRLGTPSRFWLLGRSPLDGISVQLASTAWLDSHKTQSQPPRHSNNSHRLEVENPQSLHVEFSRNTVEADLRLTYIWNCMLSSIRAYSTLWTRCGGLTLAMLEFALQTLCTSTPGPAFFLRVPSFRRNIITHHYHWHWHCCFQSSGAFLHLPLHLISYFY